MYIYTYKHTHTHTHTLHNIETLVGQMKKIGTPVAPSSKEIFPRNIGSRTLVYMTIRVRFIQIHYKTN